ncbi:MAG: T9SS type A sorting domain-containing protein, partial [Candidatus Marinimicrobia bacterium]|nr:T9SS type A sorting domain-containing protein [Candidatus Neomarinimicrobiota bacterium]
ISGDGTFGIGLWSNGTSFNTIQGNFIGTDVSGTTVHGSFSGGIFSDGADYNLFEDNLIGGYLDNGVSLNGVSDGYNTVRGNYIGTDTSGVIQIAKGRSYGVSIDNSGYNVVGPSNVIARNGISGITIQGEEAVGNRITQNSIYNNGGVDIYGGVGIELWYGGNLELDAPAIFDFDMQAGTVTGVACANCTVEIFSDNSDQGEIYEGQTTTDPTGLFSFTKGAPFSRSRLTATATDADGNTSQFSVYTPDVPSRNVILQDGNSLSKTRLQTKRSEELADNRIGGSWELRWAYDLGLKRSRLFLNAGEEDRVDWNRSEFEVPPELDNWATSYAAHGVTTFMNLNFWDKANHPGGWTEPAGFSRFQIQNNVEIERYIEFVQFVVNHFKDRVQYYELWNEPDNSGFPLQYIKIPDYINLVQQVEPVIRDIYPEAKIMVGAGANLIYQLDYMFDLVSSEEIMQLVDVVIWHPFYGQSPAYEDTKDYYDQYPSIVQAIKDTAYANGFRGEYFVDEVSWDIEGSPSPYPYSYSEIQSAKYYARGIVTHLGLDVTVEVAGPPPYYVTQYAVVGNLCTVMAGATTDTVAIQIQSDAADLRSYSFSLPDGDKMIALWTDGVAVDYDPGVAATLTLPGLADKKMTGIDVLTGFQQELVTEVINDSLVIRNLMVKDYPIIMSSASIATSVTDNDRSPFTFALHQNYPNPFNPQTTITYELKDNARVSLKIYNILGQLVETVVNDYKTVGYHSVLWNAGNVSSGLYFYRIEAGEYTETKKCLILK